MRAVVKKRFKDKYTEEVYEAGSELELTQERYAEIRETDAALIVAVAEEPEQGQGSRAQQKQRRMNRGQGSRTRKILRQTIMRQRRQDRRSQGAPESRRSRMNNGEGVCPCILQQYSVEEMQGVIQG